MEMQGLQPDGTPVLPPDLAGQGSLGAEEGGVEDFLRHIQSKLEKAEQNLTVQELNAGVGGIALGLGINLGHSKDEEAALGKQRPSDNEELHNGDAWGLAGEGTISDGSESDRLLKDKEFIAALGAAAFSGEGDEVLTEEEAKRLLYLKVALDILGGSDEEPSGETAQPEPETSEQADEDDLKSEAREKAPQVKEQEERFLRDLINEREQQDAVINTVFTTVREGRSTSPGAVKSLVKYVQNEAIERISANTDASSGLIKLVWSEIASRDECLSTKYLEKVTNFEFKDGQAITVTDTIRKMMVEVAVAVKTVEAINKIRDLTQQQYEALLGSSNKWPDDEFDQINMKPAKKAMRYVVKFHAASMLVPKKPPSIEELLAQFKEEQEAIEEEEAPEGEVGQDEPEGSDDEWPVAA
jgi:hypothetical protein